MRRKGQKIPGRVHGVCLLMSLLLVIDLDLRFKVIYVKIELKVLF